MSAAARPRGWWRPDPRASLLAIIDRWQVNPNRPKGLCVFEPSCSHYAREALLTRSLPVSLALVVWRILRCNPFSRGGADPVPPPRVLRKASVR